jgi:hypothetical protein
MQSIDVFFSQYFKTALSWTSLHAIIWGLGLTYLIQVANYELSSCYILIACAAFLVGAQFMMLKQWGDRVAVLSFEEYLQEHSQKEIISAIHDDLFDAQSLNYVVSFLPSKVLAEQELSDYLSFLSVKEAA